MGDWINVDAVAILYHCMQMMITDGRDDSFYSFQPAVDIVGCSIAVKVVGQQHYMLELEIMSVVAVDGAAVGGGGNDNVSEVDLVDRVAVIMLYLNFVVVVAAADAVVVVDEILF